MFPKIEKIDLVVREFNKISTSFCKNFRLLWQNEKITKTKIFAAP